MSFCPHTFGAIIAAFVNAQGGGGLEDGTNDPDLGFVYASYFFGGFPGYATAAAANPDWNRTYYTDDDVLYNNAYYNTSGGDGNGYQPAYARNGTFESCLGGGYRATFSQPGARRLSPWTGGAYTGYGLWNDMFTLPNDQGNVDTKWMCRMICRPESSANTQVLLAHPQWSLTLNMTAGTLVYDHVASATYDITANISDYIVKDVWTQVSVVHDGAGTVTLWVAGQLVGTSATGASFTTVAGDDRIAIGMSTTNTNRFTGLVQGLVVNGNSWNQTNFDEWTAWYSRVKNPTPAEDIYNTQFDYLGVNEANEYQQYWDYARLEYVTSSITNISADRRSFTAVSNNPRASFMPTGVNPYNTQVNGYNDYSYFEFQIDNSDGESGGFGIWVGYSDSPSSVFTNFAGIYERSKNSGQSGSGSIINTSVTKNVSPDSGPVYTDIFGVSHDALTGTIKAYKNGVLLGTYTHANFVGKMYPMFSSETTVTAGYTADVTFFMDPADWTYTPADVPSNEGDAEWDNTVLLVHGDTQPSTTATDSTGNVASVATNVSLSVTDAFTVSSSYGTPFGAGDALIRSSGFLYNNCDAETGWSSPLSFLGDFTLEFWVYVPSSTTLTGTQYLANWGNQNPSTTYSCLVRLNDGSIDVTQYNSAAPSPGVLSRTTVGTPSLPRNQWIHCAYVRIGDTLTWYQDGAVIYTWDATSMSQILPNNGDWCWGSRYNNDASTQTAGMGLFDIRVTNGTGRYSSAFTPPTSPFNEGDPVIGGSHQGIGLPRPVTVSEINDIAVGDVYPGKSYNEFGHTRTLNYRDEVLAMGAVSNYVWNSDNTLGSYGTVGKTTVSDLSYASGGQGTLSTEKLLLTDLISCNYTPDNTGRARYVYSYRTEFSPVGQSFVMWFKLDSATNQNILCSLGEQANTANYYGVSFWLLANGDLRIQSSNGTSSTVSGYLTIEGTPSTAVSVGESHMVVLEVTGTTFTTGQQDFNMWLDGVQLSFSGWAVNNGTSNGTAVFSSSQANGIHAFYGRNAPTGQTLYCTNGLRGPVAIFDRALTQTEIDKLWWHRGTFVQSVAPIAAGNTYLSHTLESLNSFTYDATENPGFTFTNDGGAFVSNPDGPGTVLQCSAGGINKTSLTLGTLPGSVNTKDWCWEADVYITSHGTVQHVAGALSDASNYGPNMQILTSGILRGYAAEYPSGGWVFIDSLAPLPTNQWVNLKWQGIKSEATTNYSISLWVDGVKQGEDTMTTPYTSVGSIYIGGHPTLGRDLQGYIKNVNAYFQAPNQEGYQNPWGCTDWDGTTVEADTSGDPQYGSSNLVYWNFDTLPVLESTDAVRDDHTGLLTGWGGSTNKAMQIVDEASFTPVVSTGPFGGYALTMTMQSGGIGATERDAIWLSPNTISGTGSYCMGNTYGDGWDFSYEEFIYVAEVSRYSGDVYLVSAGGQWNNPWDGTNSRFTPHWVFGHNDTTGWFIAFTNSAAETTWPSGWLVYSDNTTPFVDLDAWSHIAIQKDSSAGTFTAWVNGTRVINQVDFTSKGWLDGTDSSSGQQMSPLVIKAVRGRIFSTDTVYGDWGGYLGPVRSRLYALSYDHTASSITVPTDYFSALPAPSGNNPA